MTLNVSVSFNPHDIWVGVFWKFNTYEQSLYRNVYVYVCIVPMIPVLLKFEWGYT